MTICTRPSCGADLDVSSSEFTSTPCIHHPGAPVFHEGQKSWSCCKEVNKPVLDFDDFVKIKGCTTLTGHSTERPKQAQTTKPSTDGAGVKGTKREDGSEVFGSSNGSSTTTATTTTPSVPPPAPATKPLEPAVYVEPSDPDSLTSVPVGAICKRAGCGHKNTSEGVRDRSSEECHYHKGFPIFHEGSKGYSCCKRRVLEFSEFLKITPCSQSTSGHLYTQPPKSKNTSDGDDATDLLTQRGLQLEAEEVESECKMDHYETPDEIRMTIYCKGISPDSSKILIESNDLLLSLSLPANIASDNQKRRFLYHLPLYAEIEPHPVSSYTISTSKIKMDLTLVKKNKGQSWPSLQRGTPGSGGYGLTFGRS
ncbi:unnamed protein product [Sympodiomycopsis kandeliae]